MTPAGSTSRPTSRPATLRDVAELAGVSISTVSKALNGRQHVHAQTRARVQQAAEQLDFAPNALARGLLNGRTGTVGLLTNDLEGRLSLPVLMGAEDAFGAGSTSVFLCDARGDAVRERHHVTALIRRRVDGLIVVGDTTNPRRSLGRTLPVPVVYAYAPSDDATWDISVVNDNVTAGAIAAEHLLSCHRTRIAYISGDAAYHAARDRVAGASAALAQRDVALLGGRALYGSWSEGWGRSAMRTVLTRFPDVDGVLCGSDQVGRGVLDVLREAGRDVPGDVAVQSHDNWEVVAAHSRPPMSSVDMRLPEVGRLAARLLYDAIDGRRSPGHHVVDTRLVARGSTVAAG